MPIFRAFMTRPYLVAIGAAILLSLGFPIIGLWPFLIPGLALYFLNAAYPGRSRRQTWWSGLVTGVIVEFLVYYQGLSHLQILPGAETFSHLARLSPPVLALAFGTVFGATAVLYQALRTRSPLLCALGGASLYTAGEMLAQQISQGYYWASLAHPFAAFAPALTIASLGGAFLVSFCVAWVAALAAEYFLRGRAALPAAAATALLLFLLWAAAAGLQGGGPQTGSLTVVSVQVGDPKDIFAGSAGPFIGGAAKALLAAAGTSGADLVIYPQSLTSGALYEGAPYVGLVRGEPVVAPLSAAGPWLKTLVAPESIALVWPGVYNTADNRFYEAFEFYKDGASVAEYRKQLLFPFTDYYPPWMRALGLVARGDTLTPGPPVAYTQVGPWRIGALDCSELNRPELARQEARASALLLSMGSDTPFNNGLPPQYSLAAARYRAAEHHIPVLRVALGGPSAIINRDGSLGPILPAGQSGLLEGTITLYQNQQTVYNRLGSLPLGLCMFVIIASALVVRLRRKP